MSKKTAWVIVAALLLAAVAAYANSLRPQWGTADTIPD